MRLQMDDSINSLLSKIASKRNKFKKLFNDDKSKEQLYKWLKSELAYTSNNIEGNTLTRKETRLVIEEDITSSSKPFVHYQEAVNHAKAFDYIIDILKSKITITENVVLDIHKKLLSGIDDYNAGFYRNCPVRISGSRVILPNPMKVPDLMNEFFEKFKQYNLLENIIKLHLDFVTIHPFADGNGRCARLLMNLLLMCNGFCPIIIRPRDRKRYINSIEKAQLTGDVKVYIKFMLSRLSQSFDTIFDIFDNKNEVPQEKLMTIAKFAKAVELPVSTIRYWVKVGKLKPTMYTESGYMMFSHEQIKKVKQMNKK
ncbi:Fic family protein [bacterium]|nr:Fic family protein [bacterium]